MTRLEFVSACGFVLHQQHAHCERLQFSGSADVSGVSCNFCHLFHVLRFLQTPVADPASSTPNSSLDPASSFCPALASESYGLIHGVHLPSLVFGICFCEAILTARILAFRAALRRFGYEGRAPLYHLLLLLLHRTRSCCCALRFWS